MTTSSKIYDAALYAPPVDFSLEEPIEMKVNPTSDTQAKALLWDGDTIDDMPDEGVRIIEATKQGHAMTLRQMIMLNIFWAGYSFYWFLILVVVLPSHIAIISPTSKGTSLAIVTGFSGLFNLIVALVIGSLNDRSSSRYGRRRPTLVVGTLLMCISMYGLQPDISLTRYTIVYIIMTFATILASAPFYGLVADLSETGHEGRGGVSSVMGTCALIGFLLAAVVGSRYSYLGQTVTYVIITIVLLSTLCITVFSTHEVIYPHSHGPFVLRKFLKDLIWPLIIYRDFRLVFISRFLFQLGVNTVQQYLQYWIADCITDLTLPSTEAVSLALIPLLICSPIGSSILLIPSLRSARKSVVYGSALIMGITCIVMIVVDKFYLTFLVGAMFGIGYGPFVSVEFAILMDCLPSPATAAKDISLWHSALILPQLFATPLAGLVRDSFQNIGDADHIHCLGYKIIFLICIIYFSCGAFVTRMIKSIN